MRSEPPPTLTFELAGSLNQTSLRVIGLGDPVTWGVPIAGGL